MGLLSEAAAQVVIPLAAAVGIGFALLQWILVSRVSVSGDPAKNDGFADNLMGDEEESADQHAVVVRCAEIQSAISVGESRGSSSSGVSAPYRCLRL